MHNDLRIVLVLPKFNLPKFAWRLIHQHLAPPNFSAIRCILWNFSIESTDCMDL